MAFIISSDDIKQTLTGYDPRRAGDLHDRSTELADAAYEQALNNRPEKTVILMSGGSASGKSEYVSAYLGRRRAIISDGTSSTFERAQTKIELARRAGKRVEVIAVWPLSFRVALNAFLNRKRQFSIEHFYRTHSHSRKTLLAIAREYPDIPITIIKSSYYNVSKNQKIAFDVSLTRNRQELIEYISQNQYTENKIRQDIDYEI